MIKKIYFAFFSLISLFQFSAKAEDTYKIIESLINEAQQIADKGGDIQQFERVIEKYMEFKEIASKILTGVKRDLKTVRPQTAETEIRAFLPQFEPIFKPYIIKKYATPENLEKFKSMTPEISKNIVDNKDFYIVRSHFKSSRGSLGDINVNWHVNKAGKVIDIVFEDAGASPLRIEASQARDEFKKNGNDLSKLLEYYRSR